MGLGDRDYMKRTSKDDFERASSPDDKLEALFSGFLHRHPRFFVKVSVLFVVLIVLAIIIAKLIEKNQ